MATFHDLVRVLTLFRHEIASVTIVEEYRGVACFGIVLISCWRAVSLTSLHCKPQRVDAVKILWYTASWRDYCSHSFLPCLAAVGQMFDSSLGLVERSKYLSSVRCFQKGESESTLCFVSVPLGVFYSVPCAIFVP